MKYIPCEVFLQCIDQSGVDKSTEEWLNTIEDRLTYSRWTYKLKLNHGDLKATQGDTGHA